MLSEDEIQVEEIETRFLRMQELRELMGTEANRLSSVETRFVRGGEEVEVKFIGGKDENWYRSMYVMAVQTWGGVASSGMDKWDRATPKARMDAVQSIINRKALPLALEHPQFLFEISGCSRSAFDQIARARIGVTFSSMGTRDNAHADVAFVVPPVVYDDPKRLGIVLKAVDNAKASYADLLRTSETSWQDARAVLPAGVMHRFAMSINYAALSTLCSKRLQFCEQYDTVMVAWRLKETLSREYAMLAEALRPGCDFAKRCTYHENNELQEAFSCLFKGCGRWPDPQPYYEFNESSTRPEDIEEWLGYKVPQGDAPINWETARERDASWFSDEWVFAN